MMVANDEQQQLQHQINAGSIRLLLTKLTTLELVASTVPAPEPAPVAPAAPLVINNRYGNSSDGSGDSGNNGSLSLFAIRTRDSRCSLRSLSLIKCQLPSL